MEKEDYYDIDEKIEILPPYWWVEYVDDWGDKHIATIKNQNYLNYLETNFIIIDKKNIGI